jgi:hypothetical protein
MFDDVLGKQLDTDYPLNDYYPDIAKVKKNWDLTTVGYISDEFKCYKSRTGEYPAKTANYNWKFGWAFTAYMMQWDFTDDVTSRLWTHGMSSRMIKEFDERISKVKTKVKKKKRLNFFGLSGHETNILPFMVGYGLTSEKCIMEILKSGKNKSHTNLQDEDLCLNGPDFASSFIWELSKKKNTPDAAKHDPKSFFVRVIYNGESLTTHCPKDQLVDGDLCPYLVFKEEEIKRFQFESKEARDNACNNISDEPEVQWEKFAFVLMGVLAIQIFIFICMSMKKNDAIDDGMLNDTLNISLGQDENKKLQYSNL